MGYQHLESHPETSPVGKTAAMRDRRKRRGHFSKDMVSDHQSYDGHLVLNEL